MKNTMKMIKKTGWYSVMLMATPLLVTPLFALEAMQDNEMTQVTGQDGLDIAISLVNKDNDLATPVDAVTADYVQYIDDGEGFVASSADNSAYLQNFAVGPMEMSDRTTDAPASIRMKFDVYSIAGNDGGAGIPLDISWDRLGLRNSIRLGGQAVSNTLFDWQIAGSGEIKVNSFLGTGGGNGGGIDTAGYLKLDNYNINMLNPAKLTALMVRDLDLLACLHSGAVNVGGPCAAPMNGSDLFSAAFANAIGYKSDIGIDGQLGMFVSSNRLEFATNFVLSHRNFGGDQGLYDVAYIQNNPSTDIQDYFGVEISGPLHNFTLGIGGGGSAGVDGIKFLLSAQEDSNQVGYTLPSIKIFESRAPTLFGTGAEFYNANGNRATTRALRFDNFSEFHNSANDTGGVNVPGLYLPFTLDIVDGTYTASQNYDALATSPAGYNLSVAAPGTTSALLTVDSDLHGAGSPAGMIDMYARNWNIGTLDTAGAGATLGSFVLSLRDLNSKFLFAPSQSVAGAEPGAQLSFGGFGSIDRSGFGWINNGFYAGVRDFGGFIVVDPLKSYLYEDAEGYRFRMAMHLATNDFSVGISKAFNVNGTNLTNRFNMENAFLASDEMFSMRLRLLAETDILLKPGVNNGELLRFKAQLALQEKDAADIEKQNLLYVVDNATEGDVEWGLSNIRGTIVTANADNSEAVLKFGTQGGETSLRAEIPFKIADQNGTDATVYDGLPTISANFDMQRHIANAGAAYEVNNIVNAYIPAGAEGQVNIEIWGY